MKSRVTAPASRASCKPLRHGVDGDDAIGAEQEGAADGELPDRTAAPDRDRLAALDIAEIGGHVAGREDVRQEQHLLVAQAVRHFDRPDIGIRARADIRPGRRHSRRADANSRTGRPANGPTASRPCRDRDWCARSPRRSPVLQKKHSPQAMVKGTTTRSPTFSFLFSEPTSTTSPMVSWPRTSPFSIVGMTPSKMMQVGAADGAGGDFDDGVARVLDLGIGHGLAANVVLAVPGQRFHPKSPSRGICAGTKFGEKIGSYSSRNDNGKQGLEDRMATQEIDYVRFPTFCDRHRCVHGHRI